MGLLKDEHPELTKEWYRERNDKNGFYFDNVTCGSGKKVWWKCKKGHEWEASICNRAKGTGCPYCAGRMVLPGFNDLATLNPELANEWNYEKNDTLKPKDFTVSSSKKVWWRCEKGHEWEAQISNRNSGNGCPYCAGRMVLPGFNDLATLDPQLSNEWNYEKNAGLLPQDFTLNSNKKVWWRCKNGHEWEASICKRAIGRGCPVCSHNLRISFPEKAIFFYIQQAFPDAVENYKPAWLGRKELDIYIPSKKTGIEYDGVFYHKNKAKDAIKDRLCSEHGITIIRIREKGLDDTALKSIVFTLPESPKTSGEHIIPGLKFLEEQLGVNLGIDMPRDYDKIRSMVINYDLENYIAKTNPELLDEWDYQKNGQVGNTPENISAGARVIVWWKCKNGHSYRATPNNRTSHHTGCPYCSSRKIERGFNDLSTKNPQLASEWDYKKNGDLKPQDVTAGSGKKVWWKCKKGHEWEACVVDRNNGNGCPYCAGKKVLHGFNDLATLNPGLANEWNYEKNGILRPKDFTASSNKKVWWKCEKGHEWEASISNRSKGRGCPYCAGKRAAEHKR
ncbi:zinc-ribbon domain-containing protein [Candidatus Saccharibacteria bacterium]|nr:zinc-ribbon domain-containing protein [Candidatus Saccharibacteria bacterium]